MGLLAAAQRIGPAERGAAMQVVQRLAQALSLRDQAGDILLQFRITSFKVAVFPLQGVDVQSLAGHG